MAALAIACSTPITGILSYTIAATLLGEDRLEGSQGLTTLGWSAMAVPIVIGLVAFGLSFSGLPVPSRRTFGLASGVVSAAFLWLGATSLVIADPGDASIGGGLLVLAAAPLLATAVHLTRPPGNSGETPDDLRGLQRPHRSTQLRVKRTRP